MDIVSYLHADKQAKRIKKVINDPDSSSGIITVPKVIASGDTVTIPAGRVAVLPNIQVDGTLNIEGEVFIPSGSTFTPSVTPSVVVNTIADLKSNTSVVSAEVLGYYTKGDGGGGLFYWDSTSTEPDNGGTIIQVTGIAIGRWKRVYEAVVDVKAFNSIDSAKNTKDIYISRGNYIISTSDIPEIASWSKHKNSTVSNGIYDGVIQELADGKLCLQSNHLEFANSVAPYAQFSEGSLAEAPEFTGNKQTNINVIAHWYNDFGLDATRQSEGGLGWVGWYYWSWLFHGASGDGYDSKRHPLLGYYKGDNSKVLDWICYWLSSAGVTGVSLQEAPSTILTATSGVRAYWVKQLFTTKNFRSLQYNLWLPTTPNEATIDNEVLAILEIYRSNPNISTYNYNGKSYPIIFVFDLELMRGTLDSYSGDTNTKAKLVDIANIFKNAGYQGVCFLARNATTTLVGDQNLVMNDCIVLSSQYETVTVHGGVDDGTYDYLATYASGNSVSTQWGVPSVATDLDSHSAHPSTFNRTGSTPEKFYRMCVNSIRQARKFNAPKIMTVYNVSEWAEGGAGLIPNMRDGFGYLNALAKALSATSEVLIEKPSFKKQTTQFLSAPSASVSLENEATTVPLSVSFSWASTATPFINTEESDIYNGRRIRLSLASDSMHSGPITLQDDRTLSGSGLYLESATVSLSINDSVELEYDSYNGKWVQCSKVINIM